MRVLIVVDCKNWAIDSLCQGIAKNLKDRFDINIVYVHPREVAHCVSDFKIALSKGVDLINFHYWRSATQLMEIVPELRDYPKILTHHNHESLEKEDWSKFEYLTHFSNYGTELLKKNGYKVQHIPHGIDIDRYSYIDDETYRKTSKEIRIGYVGRIVPWKRLHLTCEVAKELGYKVIASGYIDKANYWKDKVEQYAKEGVLEFNGGIGRMEMMPAVFKDNLYKQMTIFTMASEGEYESGPLPAMEAMARGIPVLSTKKGSMKDRIEDGKNGLFFEENDKEHYKAQMKKLVEDEGLRMKLRKEAWDTAKGYTEKHMADQFGRLYYDVYSSFKKQST